ncbi:hypothetical protein NC652_017593 [Populus alba x Populus x berolinensis]|nr:hypothetical protein NC652_017593 [Populus alba x Populus x berolinensis]
MSQSYVHHLLHHSSTIHHHHPHHPHHHQLTIHHRGRHKHPSWYPIWGTPPPLVYNFNTPNGQAPLQRDCTPILTTTTIPQRPLLFHSTLPISFYWESSMLSTSCSSCKRDRYSMVRSLLVNYFMRGNLRDPTVVEL